MFKCVIDNVNDLKDLFKIFKDTIDILDIYMYLKMVLNYNQIIY